MRISVPRLVQDRLYLFRSQDPAGASDVLLAVPFANTVIDDEGPFLDGPVSPRIAVVDLDADTGTLRPASVFESRSGRFDGVYRLDEHLLDPDVDALDLEDTHFVQQSVFATACRTLQFFEDLLGRRIPWAFPGGQLLIVPRAGRMENAYYERESRSLQFFEFPVVSRPGHKGAQTRLVYTALSHDIVAHETAHAILDGIDPDLYDAILPESLALHESIADLAAIFLTLLNDMVVWSIVNISSSSLDTLGVLARVAEEFGYDIRRDHDAEFLRSADNDYVLGPGADGPGGTPVDRHSPHDCSQVLTGAVFRVFRRHVQALSGDTEKKILRASRDMCAVLFPALDLLPPGEAGFADFAGAVSAVARISGRGQKLARWLCEELQARGVPAAENTPDLPAGLQPLGEVDDAALQRYLRANRSRLGLPPDVAPDVQLVRRDRRLGSKRFSGKEAILRIGWTEREGHAIGSEFSGEWSVRTGITIVFSGTDGRPLALVEPSRKNDSREQRSRQLQHWMAEGLLVSGAHADSGGAVTVERVDGVFSARSAARTLHIVG